MEDIYAAPKWLFLHCLLGSTLAFSLPNSRNASSHFLPITNSTISLTAPVFPAGFEAIVTLNRNEPLSLNFTGTNFVSFLYSHYQQDPDTVTQEERWYRANEPSFFVQPESRAQSLLTVNHVILGLNKAAMTMVLPGNGFFEAKVSLMLQHRRIGTIDIYMGGSADSTEMALPLDADTNHVFMPRYPANNEIARGLVVDRTWPDMAVEWLYEEDQSKAVSENDMFTVIMNALTRASQSRPHDHCPLLDAASSESGSGTTVDLVLVAHLGSRMLYQDVKTMLYLMYVKFIVSSRAYREFSFELQHDVREIWGKGYIAVRDGGTSTVTATS